MLPLGSPFEDQRDPDFDGVEDDKHCKNDGQLVEDFIDAGKVELSFTSVVGERFDVRYVEQRDEGVDELKHEDLSVKLVFVLRLRFPVFPICEFFSDFLVNEVHDFDLD